MKRKDYVDRMNIYRDLNIILNYKMEGRERSVASKSGLLLCNRLYDLIHTVDDKDNDQYKIRIQSETRNLVVNYVENLKINRQERRRK